MLLDQIRDDPSISLQGPHCCCLILTHEAAVTYRVGAEDGSEFAFETFCGHGIASEGLLEGIELQTTMSLKHIRISQDVRVLRSVLEYGEHMPLFLPTMII